jgi:lysophospholipase L1-like esterase
MKSSLLFAACFSLMMKTGFTAETIYHSDLPPGANPAAYPAPQQDWLGEVQRRFDRYSGKHADIVFDGDSITSRWEGTGGQVWRQRFAADSADFGIEGDHVEHVLWRLSKGQVDGVDPKLVVLLIGTNNSGRDSVEQIAEGIKVLVAKYEEVCPNAHIVLMGIFPRGANPEDGSRRKVADVNKLIASLDDGKRVSFLDIGPKFLEQDGTIATATMSDSLHPTAKEYVVWADALQPFIDKYVPKPLNTP